MADDNKEKKGRSSYNWFITDGDWDEEEIAQRKADLFFEELGIKKKKGTGYCLLSMIPITRRKVDTPKV